MSVEQTPPGIKNVIETASLAHTDSKPLGPDSGELTW
jgi:hypothetical protein